MNLRVPTISDEVPISVPLERPAVGQQSSPLVATDGDEFLVVWSDARYNRRDIYAARVTRNGELRDRRGKRLLENVVQPLSLTYSGGSYFLVWLAPPARLLGAAISRDLSLDTPRVLVDGVTSGHALASTGSKILLAYARDGILFRALLDPSGERLTRDIALARPVAPRGIAVTEDRDGFVVLWGDMLMGAMSPPPPIALQTLFRAVRIDSSGNLVTPTPMEVATTGETGRPTVVNDRTRLMVAWLERPGSKGSVRIMLLDAATLRPIDAPKTLAQLPGISPGGQISALWNGAYFVISWAEITSEVPYSSRIAALRVDSSGVALDPEPFTIAGGGYTPSLAWNGANIFAVWEGSDIRGALLTPSAFLARPDFPISLSATVQQVPVIASNGTTTVAAWREVFDDIGTSAVYAGQVVTGPVSPMSTSGAPSQHFPAIAAGETTYLVAWVEGVGSATNSLMARLMDTRGRPIHEYPIALGTTSYIHQPGVAFNGEQYLVVFNDISGLVGRRIDEHGMLGESVPVLIAKGGGPPKVSSAGRDFLVAWTAGLPFCSTFLPFWIPCSDEGFEIQGARVSGSGSVLDPVPILLATGPGSQGGPVLSSRANEYVLVYGDSDSTATLRAKRISPSGILLDGPATGKGLLVAAGERSKGNMTVAWDGQAWIVIWEDARSPGGNDDLYGVYISSDFTTVSTEIPIAVAPTHEGEPDLAVVARERVALIYDRIAPEYGDVERTFMRLIGIPQRSRPSRR